MCLSELFIQVILNLVSNGIPYSGNTLTLPFYFKIIIIEVVYINYIENIITYGGKLILTWREDNDDKEKLGSVLK